LRGGNVEEDLRRVAEPIARALGLEILEIQCLGKMTSPLVRFVMDKQQGGIGIHDCEQFHQTLMRTWHLTNPDGLSCRFEVSSPGLDRPLKNMTDFQRVVGKLVKVTLKSPIANSMVVVGRLMEVSEAGIEVLASPSSNSKSLSHVNVPWDTIAKARLEVEF
jgi:ribosome maturation factor RimP